MDTTAIVSVIRDLELRLMTPAIRNDPDTVGPLLADDFLEFGSSGRTYDKAAVLSAIANDATPAPDMEAFSVRCLSSNLVLATYQTSRYGVQGEHAGRTLRSSLWRQVGDRWQLVFHQGTPVVA